MKEREGEGTKERWERKSDREGIRTGVHICSLTAGKFETNAEAWKTTGCLLTIICFHLLVFVCVTIFR